MGFLSWPNMALLNPCFKDQIGLILGEKEPVERERGGQRREEEEEEEEEEKKKEGSSPKRYGCLDFDMELWFCMDFLSRYKFVGYGL